MLRLFTALAMFMLISVNARAEEKKSAPKINYRIETQNLRNADPVSDLNHAIKNKDYRFKAVYGFALEVPGISDFDKKYPQYGFNPMEGTSDHFDSKDAVEFDIEAKKYAEKYNRLLEAKIKSGAVKLDSLPAEWLVCKKDSDCVDIQYGCTAGTVNKKFENEADSYLKFMNSTVDCDSTYLKNDTLVPFKVFCEKNRCKKEGVNPIIKNS